MQKGVITDGQEKATQKDRSPQDSQGNARGSLETDSQARRVTALITTCKGRLSHLRRSLPLFAAEFPLVVVVDWDCPDGTFEWLTTITDDWCRNVYPLDVPNQPLFHKTLALNKGADYAQQLGATHYCFADADTLLIHKGTRAELDALPHNTIALTGPKTFARSSLIGFLYTPAERFHAVGGFDESYIGWGYEDLDMRVRLLCEGGCKPTWLPETYFAEINHKNPERSRFQIDSIQKSAARNRAKFLAMLRERLAEYWSQDLKDATPYR